jgi:hypothetical protein
MPKDRKLLLACVSIPTSWNTSMYLPLIGGHLDVVINSISMRKSVAFEDVAEFTAQHLETEKGRYRTERVGLTEENV